MLKHNDIISKLTDSQKARILTCVADLEGKDFKILGIPKIKIGNMKDYDRAVFVHTTSLSNAFDVHLWEDVANEKLKTMAADGVNFVIAPGARIKLSPFRREVSEDPVLASAMSEAHLSAAKANGFVVGASGYYLASADTVFMDDEPSERVINEYVCTPYRNAVRNSGADAVMTDMRRAGGKYEDVCRKLQEGISSDVEFMVCPMATDENTVELISRGIICLEGSTAELESAMARYKKTMRSIENGEGATHAQLEDEIKGGVSISDEMVDSAVDNVLEFLFRCDGQKQLKESEEGYKEELALRAALESTVLLKNDGDVLPMKGGRVAIVGDVAFNTRDGLAHLAKNLDELFEKAGYDTCGIERGYTLRDPIDSDNVNEALHACYSADTVLLFVGFSYEDEKRISVTESLTIPANQLYFADRLSRMGKRVVAIVGSGHAPDIEFTRPFSAVVYAPLRVDCAAESLFNILTGKYNPTGRLASSLYAGTEAAFDKRDTYKKKYGLKSGPFIGYRYYDTAGIKIGYPFGHGLSYTSFSYTALTVKNGKISFTVENVGDVKGEEVAQVYVGCDRSCVVRPKKELVAFVRIPLEPGERKRVTLSAALPQIYSDGALKLESGEYTVYVGASVSDIRLKERLTVSSVWVAPDGEKLSDYIESISNITEDNYTLEANYSFMKKSVKNILFGVGSLALAISVAVFNAFTEASSVFLGVVSGILAVSSIIFFILEAAERSRAAAEHRKNVDEVNMQYFEGAEELPVLSTSKMFADEFDAEAVVNYAAESEEEENVEVDVRLEYLDNSFNMQNLAEEINRFAAERGYKLKAGVAEGLIAAMATSRLVLVDGLDDIEFASFVRLMSDYFGTDACIDNAAIGEEANPFFAEDSQGDNVKRNLLIAIESASRVPERIQLAAINGIGASMVADKLSALMRYFNAPHGKSEIYVTLPDGHAIGHAVNANLWVFVNLSSTDGIDKIPLAAARTLAVAGVSFTKTPSAEVYSNIHSLNSYQLDYMIERETGKTDITEESWKKIDKLEKYVSEHSDYRIGNKLWLGFEKHLDILVNLTGQVSESLDSAVAARLIPSMAAAVRGNLTKEDKTLSEMLDFIFGEENVGACKAVIGGFTDKKNA